jgi:Phage P22-like portal protein
MAEYARDATDPKALTEDEAILKELQERFDYAAVQWAPIIDEANIDVAYTGGNTWNSDDESARAGRPMLKLDQLSQYTNQLVNSFRQNPRGAKVSPAGAGATDQTAELRANRIRQIEHDSHAQEVYTVAGENAVTRGYGFARIVAEYEDSTSANQALRLKAVPNPNQVLPDPDAESTSGADWSYLFFVHTVTKREFHRDYPDAQIKDFDADTIALAPRWFGKDGRVQIAEYWYVTETASRSGQGRPDRHVCMYLTNGVELLAKKGYPKKTEWPGSSIPFAACYGKIVYQTDAAGDAQKMLQSYVRLARDAAKGYNWTKSTELEALALPVKAALFAYQGQLDQTQVDLVERSTREPIALIQAKATLDETGQNVLPLPQYGTRAPDIQGYEIAAESFRRDVQNALGRYSAADHRMGSTKVTSGVALRELDKSGDLGSYHFVAHYDDMIRELASKLNELLPFYDDAAKDVSTRLPDGTTKVVTINTPTGRDATGTLAYQPDDLRMDQGRHTVTISTGPSSDSQREAGKDAAMALLANPQAFPVIASDSIRLMDLGPIGDQMAEDLEFLQPPAMQQARAQKDGGAPDPRQLTQENQQLKQQVQHAEQVMHEMDGQLKGKQAELASKEKIAQLEIDSKERIAALDRETKITVAELGAKVDRMELFLEERSRVGAHLQDASLQAADHLHEHQQSELDRQHAAAQLAVTQSHQVGLAAAGAGAARDAQAAGHQQALEVGQQAADLAPPPTNGTGA